VAVKWHLSDEPDVDRARALLRAFRSRQLRLFAPTQIRHEIPSAISVACRARPPRLSRAEGEQAIREFLAIDLHLTDDTELAVAAFHLVGSLGIAYYDALYVALAERHHIGFVTADRRLYDRVRHLPGVVWLSRWTPPA
jgi:predicted nucleic acid-binding protein